MVDALSTFNTRRTPQSVQAEPTQVKNRAGGYVFQTTDEEMLRRFLTIGSNGDYYSTAKDLTVESGGLIVKMANEQPDVLLRAIVDVSTRGAAPKQQPAIFALAIAASHGPAEARGAALAAIPQVCRTGSTLFQFAAYIEQFRGWGPALQRGVGNWFTMKDADSLAYQMVKYRNRNGYSGRDLLRLSHPKVTDPALRAVFEWMVRGTVGDHTPRLIEGFLKANSGDVDVAQVVRDYRLSWEMLPDEALGQTKVWDALLDVGVPQTALMRQLPRLTRLGMLPQVGGRTAQVAAQLQDAARLKKGRVHPMNVLIAMRTYESGRSLQGSSTWTPTRKIVDALDAAFYNAYGAVEPAGKRSLVALDVSGSMASAVAGLPISAREASAALALVMMATEPETAVVGYTAGSGGGGYWSRGTAIRELNISPRQRLTDAVREVAKYDFGGTDCALPFVWAKQKGYDFDVVASFTDNETWAGPVHVHQALREYREAVGHPVKAVAAAFAATSYSVLDSAHDADSLNVVGLDSAVPSLITEFARGL